MNLFFCGGISQKLVCMLCRLKRYILSHQESRGERGIIRFLLAISVKYVVLEATEGFVEKLAPDESSAFMPNDHRPAAVCAACL